MTSKTRQPMPVQLPMPPYWFQKLDTSGGHAMSTLKRIDPG